MDTALELSSMVSEGGRFGSLAWWSLVLWSFGVGDFGIIIPLEKMKGSSGEALRHPLLGYLGGTTQIRHRLAFPVVA